MTTTSSLSHLLKPSETSLDPVEQQLRVALRLLFQLSDPQQSLDGQGFSAYDKVSPFLMSCDTKEGPLTHVMLTNLYRSLYKYREQLYKHGLDIASLREPTVELAKKKAQQQVAAAQNGAAQEPAQRVETKTYIDIKSGAIYLHIGNGRDFRRHKALLDDFRAIINQGKYNGWARYMGEPTKEWMVRLTEDIFKLLVSNKFFSTTFTELKDGAREYLAGIEQREIEARMIAEKRTQAQEREFIALMECLDGLDGEVGTGIKLYQHQKEAAELALHKHRVIIADEPGLGKTFEALTPAKARQKLYNERVYIITTKTSVGMWQQACEIFDVRSEVFGWGEVLKMDTEEDERWPYDFTLIVDEAQYMCNMEAKRTKKILALGEQPHCKAVYALTGTPVPNGRPINLYPILLLTRNQLVWDESPAILKRKKSDYLRQYCGMHHKNIGKKTVTDVTGATNLSILHSLTIWKPGRQNHAHANEIARRKKDCVDLPAKQRLMDIVELSDDARAVFNKEVIAMWQQFERNVEEKLTAYKLELEEEGVTGLELKDLYAEKEESIRQAQALVGYGILRQAGEVAKIDTVVERAGVLLENKERLVIFSCYAKVAHEIKRRIEQEFGVKVGLIDKDLSQNGRTALVDEFNREGSALRVVVSTAAGGEAISLVGTPDDPCSYMMIVGRPWTPGRVEQWENRIHRMTTTEAVTIYWMQLPDDVSPADIKVDLVLQGKQVRIDMMQYGEVSTGMTFTNIRDLEQSAESILRETYNRALGKKARAKK